MTYTARGHQEHGVGTQECQERLRIGNDLPRHEDRCEKSANNLSTDNVDESGAETARISTDRQRVGTGVGSNDGEDHARRRKEHACASTRSPVLRQDPVVQIPHVPIAFAEKTGRRTGCRTAQEHDEDLADQNTGALGPSCLFWRRCVARNIGLVNENGTKRTHYTVDGLNHGPDKGSTRESVGLSVEGKVSE